MKAAKYTIAIVFTLMAIAIDAIYIYECLTCEDIQIVIAIIVTTFLFSVFMFAMTKMTLND